MGESIRWVTSATLTFNGIDESKLLLPAGASVDAGSWFHVWPMTGIRVDSKGSSSVSVFGSLQLGILFGTSPDLNITINNQVARQSSASATSLALGAGLGLTIGETFLVRGRLLQRITRIRHHRHRRRSFGVRHCGAINGTADVHGWHGILGKRLNGIMTSNDTPTVAKPN